MGIPTGSELLSQKSAVELLGGATPAAGSSAMALEASWLTQDESRDEGVVGVDAEEVLTGAERRPGDHGNDARVPECHSRVADAGAELGPDDGTVDQFVLGVEKPAGSQRRNASAGTRARLPSMTARC